MEKAGNWITDLASFPAELRAGKYRKRAEDDDDDDGRLRADGEESPTRNGRLLLGVANVGGSLTVLLQIALVAWGIRQLRSILARRRQRNVAGPEEVQAQASSSSSSRRVDQVPFAMLSPVAVRRLVELDPVRRYFVDVRFPAAASGNPAPFEGVLRIPESELNSTLQLREEEWEGRFPSVSKIGESDLIVFLSTQGRRAQTAANLAADLGYSGCCVLSGGIEGYVAAMSNYVDVPLKFLSRDAVATLLEKQGGASTNSGSSSIHLLDVRRHDERDAVGNIKGSQNIPVIELPKALTLDKVAWEETYHFPKFSEDDILIFQCRTNGRASWAAQLAQDAGLKWDGIGGWRLDPTQDPHRPGEPPRDSVHFEEVDRDAAREELQKLGLG